jgi:hypothetical protein
MLNKAKYKKGAGFGIMAVCWAAGIFLLCPLNTGANMPSAAPQNVIKNTPNNKGGGRLSQLEKELQGTLALPSERDITGLELFLFEPLPEVPKKVRGKAK